MPLKLFDVFYFKWSGVHSKKIHFTPRFWSKQFPILHCTKLLVPRNFSWMAQKVISCAETGYGFLMCQDVSKMGSMTLQTTKQVKF